MVKRGSNYSSNKSDEINKSVVIFTIIIAT